MLKIWSKKDFQMYAVGQNRILAFFRYIPQQIKYSWQRTQRGYADCDVWAMNDYFSELIPAMLLHLKNHHYGSPVLEGSNVNTCHDDWNKILEKMIFLWNESREETCSQQNEYEEAHTKAFSEFVDNYGMLGEKLQTSEEKAEEKADRCARMHFMKEVPEYEEIDKLWTKRERELEEYREKCQKEALELFARYFNDLWD